MQPRSQVPSRIASHPPASHRVQYLYDAATVRSLDAEAIRSGVSGFELMQRAGQFTFDVIRRLRPDGRRIGVICGHGNNGGDGWVVARLAAEFGLSVTVVATQPPKTEDAAEAARRCSLAPVAPESLIQQHFDIVVDAVLGNGLDHAPRGAATVLIDTIQRLALHADTTVIAIDVPSGLNASTGYIPGDCVTADHTCTYIGMKAGLVTGAGPAVCGQIHFHDCGIAAAIYRPRTHCATLVSPSPSQKREIARTADAHKGRAGRLLVVGSNLGYFGAARLTCEAALRTGTGLVSLATRAEHYPHIVAGREEIILRTLDDRIGLDHWLTEADVVALGPGLGQDEWARRQFAFLPEIRGPVVVDADALNLLAQRPQRIDNAVFTPHPGEAARLLDVSNGEIQKDRIASALSLQQKYGGVIVLKGAGTVIVGRDRAVSVCDRGHAGMASAGMGDVLTGVIASLLAQGAKPETAAALGVWIHALAAEDAGMGGEIGIVAGDLMQPLRRRDSTARLDGPASERSCRCWKNHADSGAAGSGRHHRGGNQPDIFAGRGI